MYLARFPPDQSPQLFWEQYYWPFARAPAELLKKVYQSSPAHVLANTWMPDRGPILDAGCGPGMLGLIDDRPSRELVGCDVSPGLLRIAAGFAPRARFEVGSLDRLPFEADTFDAYVSISSFEFCPGGPEPAFREAYRVLRPGKRALVVCLRVPIEVHFGSKIVESTSGTFTIEEVAHPVEPHPSDAYGYYYRRRELANAARKAGFERVRATRSDLAGGIAYSRLFGSRVRAPLVRWVQEQATGAPTAPAWTRETFLHERGPGSRIIAPLRALFSYWTVIECRKR